MAERGLHNLGFRLDINQILSEAKHRWLRPAEIAEILCNYQKFHVTSEPSHMPVSGSVFLFDRKVLRYFRKDGHNWRKKKDGKTVKEAHEKLKVGSVDMLHCYYAHGEESENFQRRSYWLLEQDRMHIVFVHYLDVKASKANTKSILDSETASTSSHNDTSLSFSSLPATDNLASTYTDMTSPSTSLTSAYEDAESDNSHLTYLGHNSYPETSQGESHCVTENLSTGYCSYNLLNTPGTLAAPSEYIPNVPGLENGQCVGTLDLASWGEVYGSLMTGESSGVHGSWNSNFTELQASRKGQTNYNPVSSSAYDSEGNFLDHNLFSANPQNSADYVFTRPDGIVEYDVNSNHQKQFPNPQIEFVIKDKTEKEMYIMGTGNCPLVRSQSQLSGVQQQEDGLKKVDSFSRWMSRELGEVNGFQLQSNNGYSWNEIETEDVVRNNLCTPGQLQHDTDTLNFSLSKDQLFSISDFSPNWASCKSRTKILITGRFLKRGQEVDRCNWSCMFGEVEVPATVVEDGVLCCHAPPHKAGVVPFYVTCSNRLACSEVREFEYRPRPENEMHALKRLDMLMSKETEGINTISYNIEKREMVSKIISEMEEDSYMRMRFFSGDDLFVPGSLEEQQGEEWLKDKFFSWLLQTVGPTVLDEEGQGVLHLAAALGFNWVLKPMTVAGVSIDFRDVNGWTALHWAAFCGREDTVAVLVSLGSSSGALTDPSAEYPLGRTPADLASANGYKGISGFLAEYSLTSHLRLLDVNDDNNVLEAAASTQCVSAPRILGVDVPDTLLLKDSLAAVRNATQAAARIYQIYRIQSFHRKQLDDADDETDSYSKESSAISFLAAKTKTKTKTSRLGQHDWYSHAAAIQIQKKFRGWKKRKEFLIIRERVVMIQAHVRGHQARKKYKPIIWSVGILEKVILRWRRRGSGLRGFQGPSNTQQDYSPLKEAEAEDDLLKEGRKQSEERMHKALSRVKSMVQYPEARAQYHRLLNVAEVCRRQTKDNYNSAVVSNSEYRKDEDEDEDEDDLFDVEDLLDDDTFMSMAME